MLFPWPRDWPWSKKKRKIVKIVVVSAFKSISTTITIMLWIVPQLQNTMKFLQTQGKKSRNISNKGSVLQVYTMLSSMNYSGALDNSEPLISPSNLKFISHSHSTATSQDKALLICTETCCQVPPDIQILPPVSFTPKLNSTIQPHGDSGIVVFACVGEWDVFDYFMLLL